MIKKYPAPWQLKGSGYIFLYRFSRKHANEKFFNAGFSDGGFSGLGTIMLVDYQDSSAGPYQELLFIPGKFSYQDKKLHSITKIYVSTMESVVNGRENWGIPKELAHFSFEDLDAKRQKVTVSKDGVVILEMTVKKFGVPLPVNTRLIPMPLVQKMDKLVYFTQFNGKGKGTPAKIESITVNPEFFPQISGEKPLVGMKVDNFSLEFPVARVVNL